MPDRTSNTKQRSGLHTSPVAMMRLSSLLFVFLMVGHMSAYPWASTARPQESRLVGSMQSVAFEFMGEHSTYWNLYFGWGLLVGVLLLTMAAMLWLLSDLARLAPRRISVITGTISASTLVGAYLSYRFFFIAPALSFSAATVILLTATFRLLKQ